MANNAALAAKNAQAGLNALQSGLNTATVLANQGAALANQAQVGYNQAKTTIQSGQPPPVAGGGEFGAAVTLQNARNTFNHFYNIAKFKLNLNTVAGEMKSYNKNYETIVGSAIGREIDRIKTAVNDSKTLMERSSPPSMEFTALEAIRVGGRPAIAAPPVPALASNWYMYSNASCLPKEEWTKDDILRVQNSFADAKIELYNVAQAVDNYLQVFTDEVSTNIDDIREVSKMLSTVNIMANWFSEKSGDSIAALYEIFPWSMRGLRTVMNTPLQTAMYGTSLDNATTHLSGHYYTSIGTHIRAPTPDNSWDALVAPTNSKLPANPFIPISPKRALQAHKFAKYTLEKIMALKNIVSAFSYIGDRIGGKDIHMETFMSPSDMYKSLVNYLYISSLTMGWGRSTDVVFYGADDANGQYNLITPQIVGVADICAAIPGGLHNCASPFQGGGVVGVGFALDVMGQTYGPNGSDYPPGNPDCLGIDALVGRRSIFRIAPLFNPQMCSVVECSDANLGAGPGGLDGVNYAGPAVAAGGTRSYATLDAANHPSVHNHQTIGLNAWNNPIVGGIGDDLANLTYNAAVARTRWGCVMAGIADNKTANSDTTDSISGWSNQFDREDGIFVNIIKAMAAKVFTVTGLYNMLNFADSRNYAMNPTRLIIGGGKHNKKNSSGGGSYDTPTIHADAIELYARLPLLAEFYRDVFCFEEACSDDPSSTANPNELIISMVPEVGSMWAGFIQCIFDQPIGTNGVYTENVIKRIIHEINEVYSTFKARNPKDFVLAIITDFIAEINGRYGLMSRTDINEYKTAESTKRTQYEYGRGVGDVEDFDTLDDDVRGSSVAPSARFSRVQATADNSRFDIQPSMYTALQTFRRRIDKRVRDITHTSRFNVRAPSQIPDFGVLIMSTRETMKTLQNPDDQFKAVTRMMTGMDVQSQTNREASLMFHEAIITPLTVLASLTEMLALYERTVREWDAYPVFKALEHVWNPRLPVSDLAGGAWCNWIKAKTNSAAPAVPHNTQSWRDVLSGASTEIQAAGNLGLQDYLPVTALTNLVLYAGNELNNEMRRINGPATTAALDVTQYRNLVRSSDHQFSNMIHASQSSGLTLNNILDRTDFLHPRYNATQAGRAVTAAQYAPAAFSIGHAAMPALINAIEQAMGGYVSSSIVDPDYGMHRHAAYLSVRWEALIKKMVELIYGLSANLGKMCEVSFQNNKIVINHTKLESMCSEIMATLRTDIDKFRGVIPANVIESYERVDTPGSINWIQANLFDNLFADKSQRGLKRAHLIVTRNFQLLSNIYPEGNHVHRVTYHGIGYLGGGGLVAHSGWGLDIPNGNVVERLQGWSVENTFSELTHYNTMTMSSGSLCGSNSAGPVHPGNSDPLSNFASLMSLQGVWTHNDAFEHLLKSPTTRTARPGATNPARIYAHHMFKGRHDFYLQDSANGLKERGFRGDTCLSRSGNTVTQRGPYNMVTGAVTQNMVGSKTDIGEGIMMKLNEVIAAYMRQFWDVGTSRIYSPLIEGPANGPMNQSVFKAQGWPDLAPCILSGPRDIDISNTTILKTVAAGADFVWDAAGTPNAIPVQRFMTIGSNTTGPNQGGWLESFRKAALTPGGYLPGVPHNFDDGGGANRSTGYGAISNAWHMCYPSAAGFNAFEAAVVAAGSPWLARTQRYAKSAVQFNDHLVPLFNSQNFWGNSVNGAAFGAKYGYNAIAAANADDLAIPVGPLTGPFSVVQTTGYGNPAGVAADPNDDFGGPERADIAAAPTPGGSQHLNVKGRGAAQRAWAGGPGNSEPWGAARYENQLSRSWPSIGSFSARVGTAIGVDSAGGTNCGYFDAIRVANAINAANPMPGTILHQSAMFTTSNRYLHRLKHAIMHKARELNLHDLAMMRQFVYTYIDQILGVQIEAAEVRRIETCIRLNPGFERDAAGALIGPVTRVYPIAGRVSATELEVYRADITRNSRLTRAFIVEFILNPYANRLFATIGTEINLNVAAAPVNIADVVALSTLQCEPITDSMAAVYNSCIQSVRHSMSRMCTNNGPWSAATHLGLLRGFYESGGTHPLDLMYRLFANGDAPLVTPAAAAGVTNTDADIIALYKQLNSSTNEYEGIFTASGSIFNLINGSVAAGTEVVNLTHNNSFRYHKADAASISDNLPGLCTGALMPPVTMRLLEFGVSDYFQANAHHAATFGQFANANNFDGTSAVSTIAAGSDYPAAANSRGVFPAHNDCFDKNSIYKTSGAIGGNGGLFAFMVGDEALTYGGANMGVPGLAPNAHTAGVPVLVMNANANNNGIPPLILFNLMSKFLENSVLGYNDAVGSIDDLRIINSNENNIQEVSAFPRNIGDPREVIFASTARAIFTALTETTPANVKSNATLSIADVPLRVKEDMKSQLPIFHELFKMITKKTDLLKGIMRLNIGLDRPYGRDEFARIELSGVHGRVDTYATRTHVQSATWYAALLDRISLTSDSFVSSIASTLNELNDAPLYLETSDNSITEYKSSAGVLPYMPMSTLTLFLQHPSNSSSANPLPISSTAPGAPTLTPPRDSEIGYPVYGPGSDHFKLNYGTRSLLHNYNINPLIEHMPGMVDILAKYNMTAQGQKKIDEKTFGSYCGKVVEILRYVSSSKIYATLLGGDRRVLDNISFSARIGSATPNIASAITLPTYQVTKTLSEAMNLTTSSDTNASMGEVVGYVTKGPNATAPISRRASMMYNILDLNISPINVHAMRKEIPLANLYNYAYTFDSFVSEIVESGVDTISQINANSTTHDMMAVLLKDPYARICRRGYYKHVANIARGNSSIDLYGYPRFISDQLWNKVLLNDLVGSAGTPLAVDFRSATRRADNNRFSSANIDTYQTAWSSILPANRFNSQLHFMRQDNGDTALDSVVVDTADGIGPFPGASMKGYLAELGRLRFDTKLARNMFFIANVQRIMTHKIDTELSKIHFPVVSNAAVSNRKITEYTDRETFADVNVD